jgi:hypothetical protein
LSICTWAPWRYDSVMVSVARLMFSTVVPDMINFRPSMVKYWLIESCVGTTRFTVFSLFEDHGTSEKLGIQLGKEST